MLLMFSTFPKTALNYERIHVPSSPPPSMRWAFTMGSNLLYDGPLLFDQTFSMFGFMNLPNMTEVSFPRLQSILVLFLLC